MAVWSNINRSNVALDRFDAEFFRADYIRSMERLESSGGCTQIHSIFSVLRRGLQPRYSSSGNIPVLRSVNIGLMTFNETRQEYVDKNFMGSNNNGCVSKDDILITSTGVGTLGRTSIWPNDNQAFCDGHVTILRNASVSPYLVAIFLNTKYGLTQIERHYRGSSGQIEIYPYDIGKIVIPNILFSIQKEIESLVKSYFVLVEQKKDTFLRAQRLVEMELGLDKLRFQKPIGYTTKFSELEQSRRFDPEHFYPAFHDFVSNLPKHIKLVPLATQLSFCQRGKQPVYSDHGLPVINSKHVQTNKVLLEDNRSALVNPVADLQIRFGDILMNGTGRGTLGRVAPYLKNCQAIPDNHVTILRSQSLDPAFLSFYLNSQAGQLQVESHQRGTSGQIELYPFDIKKFLVWSAPESLQKEIRNLYDQAAEAEQRSKELLEQAKTRVEQLIEEAVQA